MTSRQPTPRTKYQINATTTKLRTIFRKPNIWYERWTSNVATTFRVCLLFLSLLIDIYLVCIHFVLINSVHTMETLAISFIVLSNNSLSEQTKISKHTNEIQKMKRRKKKRLMLREHWDENLFSLFSSLLSAQFHWVEESIPYFNSFYSHLFALIFINVGKAIKSLVIYWIL